MREALKEARTAYDMGEVPVGAVIVQDGRIVGRGHNTTESSKDPSCHAEMNAIRGAAAALGGWRLPRCSMYVTLEPCSMCSGAIVLARIEELFIGTEDPKTGACVSLYNIVDDERLNHRVKTEVGLLREECGDLMKAFFRERRGKHRERRAGGKSMKKTAAILSLILLLAMLFCPPVYAGDGLTITKVIPNDQEKGKQPQNMAVKVSFSEKMDNRSINALLFTIVDPEGHSVPFQMVYSDKYPNELWVVLSETLKSNTVYTFTAKGGIRSAAGSSLAEDFTSTFKTRNTKTDSMISMGMMVVMMGVMFYATSRATKKQEEEVAATGSPRKGDNSLNPYKLAKEKGISLEEATALVEKQKEKLARQSEKLEAEKARREEALAAEMTEVQKRIEEEMEAERRANNYRVKGAASIKARGFKVPRSVVRKNKAKRETIAKQNRKKK